ARAGLASAPQDDSALHVDAATEVNRNIRLLGIHRQPSASGTVMRSARLLMTLACLVLLAPPRVQAEPLTREWEPTAVGGAVEELVTTASGGLYAQSSSGFMASFDAGDNWRMLAPPAAP